VSSNIREKLVRQKPAATLFRDHVFPAEASVNLLLRGNGLVEPEVPTIGVGWNGYKGLVIVRRIGYVQIGIRQRVITQ